MIGGIVVEIRIVNVSGIVIPSEIVIVSEIFSGIVIVFFILIVI